MPCAAGSDRKRRRSRTEAVKAGGRSFQANCLENHVLPGKEAFRRIAWKTTVCRGKKPSGELLGKPRFAGGGSLQAAEAGNGRIWRNRDQMKEKSFITVMS